MTDAKGSYITPPSAGGLYLAGPMSNLPNANNHECIKGGVYARSVEDAYIHLQSNNDTLARIVWLCYGEGLTQKAASALVGMSGPTFNRHMMSARNALASLCDSPVNFVIHELSRGAINPTKYSERMMQAKALDESRRAKNRIKRQQYMREYVQANPEAVTASSQNRRARKRSVKGRHTSSQWRALKEAYGYRCLRCQRREPEIKLAADHVVPLMEVANSSNDIENIQPLCMECNLWKNARTIDFRPGFVAEQELAKQILAPLKGRKRAPLSPEHRALAISFLQRARETGACKRGLAEGVRRSWKTRGVRPDSTSGIRGVIWDGNSGKWRARITQDGRRITLGRFITIEEARKAIEESK